MPPKKEAETPKKDQADFSALARIQALEEEVAALKALIAGALGIAV